MRLGSFKNAICKICLEIISNIYNIYVLKEFGIKKTYNDWNTIKTNKKLQIINSDSCPYFLGR